MSGWSVLEKMTGFVRGGLAVGQAIFEWEETEL